jgi:hypothetical protein
VVACCSRGLSKALRFCPYSTLLPANMPSMPRHSPIWTRWIFLFLSSMVMETSPKPPSITAMDGVPLTEVPRRPNAGKIGLSSTHTVLHFCFASNWCKNQFQRRTPATANTETKLVPTSHQQLLQSIMMRPD